MTRIQFLKSVSILTAILLGSAIAAAAPASQWSLLNSSGAPAPMVSGHSTVYDPATNALVVFGGFDFRQSPDQTNAVYLLSHANGLGGPSSWTVLIPNGAPGAPLARDLHTAVYDPGSNRMIVFGGFNPVSGLQNDVWVLLNANGTGGSASWTQLNPTGPAPAPRSGHSAVYDAPNNRLIIFGGANESEVWVLTNANGLAGTPAWTQLSPTGTTPSAGDESSAAYDSANNILIVFAGRTNSQKVTNGVWTLSSANGLGGTPHWTNIVADGSPGSPAKRWSHSGIYDPGSNRLTIFGGEAQGKPSFPFPDLGDLWVLQGANGLAGAPKWSKLKTKAIGNPPSRRDAFSAVYDQTNNRMILFGGEDYDAVYFAPWILTGANGVGAN